MGKRNTKYKRESRKSGSNNIQKTGINPLYIKLELSEAISYEKSILNSEESLIKAYNHLKNYKKLRKEELDKKAEIRDTLHTLHVILGIIERDLPKIKELAKKKKILKKEIKKEVEEKLKEIKEEKLEETEIQKETQPLVTAVSSESTPSPMEKELAEIKKRLESLSGMV